MGSKRRRRTLSSRQDRVEKLIAQLELLRTSFGQVAANKKQALLNKLSRVDITDATLLKSCHDRLCFLRAYPDNAAIMKSSEQELVAFDRRVDWYKSETGDHHGKKLLNSGIVDTTIEYPFSLGTVQLLLRYHPEALAVDWEYIDDDMVENIEQLLPLLVAWQENDTLDNDDTIETLDWLCLARGRKTASDLATFARLFASSGLKHSVQWHLYDNLDLTVTWDLTDSSASRTLHRIPFGRTYYQKGPLRTRTTDLRKELTQPATRLNLLSRREGTKMVRAINEVLAVRARELFPLTFANPSEVYTYEPGRGLMIVLFGAIPEIRLPLESNYGAMLVHNGVPIGYGVGATLFDRVEIAINVFPAFRSGESSFIIEQFFRLFYHYYGTRVFLVRSRQMGDGDIEPIKSGAFWFYYKLGFRAVIKRIRILAEEEFATIRGTRGYRSPVRMLKRLAKSDVFLHSDPEQMGSWEELSLVNLGYIVTEYAADKFNGDRQLMVKTAVRDIVRRLKIRDWKRWSRSGTVALERMAPLLANIPDLSRWSARETTNLVKVIRAKGSPQERKFALLSTRHKRFRDTLTNMAAEYDRQE